MTISSSLSLSFYLLSDLYDYVVARLTCSRKRSELLWIKIVIALGGNAIQTSEGSAEAQRRAIRMTMQTLKPLFQSDNDIVISHGNGPQIGNLLIQQSQSDSEQTPAMPLDVCGSMTQGMIGYWLETEINRVLSEIGSDRAVGTIITRVEVDKDDPRFDRPTKPIGPFYTEEEMQELKEAQPEAIYKADSAGRGYRKVVASPLPISILEHKLISTLVEQKISSLHVVVAVYLLLRKIILMKVSTPSLIKTSLARS